MAPLPDFDPILYPFLFCSGQESYNLVNVRSGEMFPMIKGSALNSRVCQPAFLQAKPGNGFEMHFSTKLLNQNNMYENNYSILHYKADFVEIL